MSVATRERPITLRDHEVRNLAGRGEIAIVRPIEPQPTHWTCQAPGMQDDGGLAWKGRCYEAGSSEDIETACPIANLGERRWVKESMFVSECGRYFARRATPTAECPMPLYDVLAADGSEAWHYGRGKNGDLKMAATSCSNRVRDVGRGENRRWQVGFEVGFIDDFDPSTTPRHPYGRSIGSKEALFLRRFPASRMPEWASRFSVEAVRVEVKRIKEATEHEASLLPEVVAFPDGRWPDNWHSPGYWDGFSKSIFGGISYHVAQQGGLCCCHVGQAEGLTPARCALRHSWDHKFGEGAWARNEWAWFVLLRRVEG